ncbi:MAG: RodZ domain-containing protein [Deltaproteobacteria bacterium]
MEEPIIKTEKSGASDLKSLREARGLTLRDIFERTRISVINLEAIEKEDFDALPPPVFTKSFIKTYAKTLETDGSIALSRYEQYLEALAPPSQKGDINTPPPTGKRYKFIFWSLAVLTGIGMIVFSISSYKSDVDIPKSQIVQPTYPTPEAKPPEASGMTADIKSGSADQTNQIAKPEEKDIQSRKDAPATLSSQSSTDRANIQQGAAIQEVKQENITTGETNRLTMEATELTWIRIRAGKNPPQEILLNPGEIIERSALNFVVDIGNAGGINVTFQGKPLGNLGKHGQVVRLKLP